MDSDKLTRRGIIAATTAAGFAIAAQVHVPDAVAGQNTATDKKKPSSSLRDLKARKELLEKELKTIERFIPTAADSNEAPWPDDVMGQVRVHGKKIKFSYEP